MKGFKIISLMIVVVIGVSCSTYKGIAYIDNNIRKIDIGMTKKKVISVLGDEYEIIEAKEGSFTLAYKSPDNGIYKLFFENEKLVKWQKEWFVPNLSDLDNAWKRCGIHSVFISGNFKKIL